MVSRNSFHFRNIWKNLEEQWESYALVMCSLLPPWPACVPCIDSVIQFQVKSPASDGKPDEGKEKSKDSHAKMQPNTKKKSDKSQVLSLSPATFFESSFFWFFVGVLRTLVLLLHSKSHN